MTSRVMTSSTRDQILKKLGDSCLLTYKIWVFY